MVDYRDLRLIKQAVAEVPFVTEGELRLRIFRSERNRVKSALINIDGRLYVDRVEFCKWLVGNG